MSDCCSCCVQVVLFLYQLELDAQLQRMLTYENFDSANSIRKERERIERFTGQLQVRQPVPQAKAPSTCHVSTSQQASVPIYISFS